MTCDWPSLAGKAICRNVMAQQLPWSVHTVLHMPRVEHFLVFLSFTNSDLSPLHYVERNCLVVKIAVTKFGTVKTRFL